MSVVTESNLAHRIEGKPRIVVTSRLRPENEARMSELFDARLNPDDKPLSREAILEAVKECDVLVPTVTDAIDAELIAAAGDRLGLIANYGAGYEHIDIKAATARGIMVTNTPAVFTEDTADLTMGLLISTTRRLGEGERVLRNGDWSGWGPNADLGHCIGGKQLGIVGMGRIGRAVARRANAFGMKIVYHNRRQLQSAVEQELRARFEPDLDKLIAEADILSLHCPATPETHHLLDARRIASMKPTSYIVNTARGQLIDEEALIQALAQGGICGAGLDVYETEPNVDPRLLALPNVVALPHLGSATYEGREEAGNKIIANIKAWADGHRPPDQVLVSLT